MIELAAASHNDNGDDQGAEASARVFVRVINTHPGTPWSQAQQAAMEARLGAPARLEDITYRLRRLDGWRPGGASRFAALYVRSEDARNGLVATRVVEGRPLKIDFTSPLQRALKWRRLATAGLGGLFLAGVLIATLDQVLERRAAASATLQSVEQLASASVRQADKLERQIHDDRELDEEKMRDRRLEVALADLDWVARSKAPSAHVEAVHWDHGFLAVEAQGDATPFQSPERPVQRAKAPVRPGVSLWGIGTVELWEDLKGTGLSHERGAR